MRDATNGVVVVHATRDALYEQRIAYPSMESDNSMLKETAAAAAATANDTRPPAPAPKRKAINPLAGAKIPERVGHRPADPVTAFVLKQPLDMAWSEVAEKGVASGLRAKHLTRRAIWHARWEATHPKRLGHPVLSEESAILDTLPVNASDADMMAALADAGLKTTTKGLGAMKSYRERRAKAPVTATAARARKPARGELLALLRDLPNAQNLTRRELVAAAKRGGLKATATQVGMARHWLKRSAAVYKSAARPPAAPPPAAAAAATDELIARTARAVLRDVIISHGSVGVQALIAEIVAELRQGERAR